MKYREIDELLSNHDFPVQDRKVLIGRLRKIIERFDSLPQNRDGRGVRHNVRKLERTTIKHVASAVRFSRNHADPQIRHKAKEFLRSIPHQSLAPLAIRASSFIGTVRKSSRRLKEQRRQENGRVIAITEAISLEEVRSLTLLLKVGKKLRLCVGNLEMARSCLEDIRDESEEYWILRYEEDIAGLLRVRCRQHTQARIGRRATAKVSRIITECNGAENAPLVLSHEVALKILNCLKIDQIDAESFALVGAIPIFLDENIKYPIPEPLCDGTQCHHVWRTKNHVVIATSKKPLVGNDRFVASKTQWSYFFLNTSHEWEELLYSNHLDLGMVLKLTLDVPEFYQVMTEIRGL